MGFLYLGYSLSLYCPVSSRRVSVLAISVEDRVFEPCPGQTRHFENGICCCFSIYANRIKTWSQSKNWSARDSGKITCFLTNKPVKVQLSVYVWTWFTFVISSFFTADNAVLVLFIVECRMVIYSHRSFLCHLVACE